MSDFILINALDNTNSFFLHTLFQQSLIDCSLSCEAAL